MIWAILVPIVACILISYLTTSILYKITFLGLGIFIAITVGLTHINNLLKDSINKSKEINSNKGGNSSNKNNIKNNTKKVTQFKPKVIENNDYDNLVNTLKFCMKNKILNREQILNFKSEVNNHLGKNKNHYTFKFDNDLHEIYCKIKHKSLKSKDYQELLQVLTQYKAN